MVRPCGSLPDNDPGSIARKRLESESGYVVKNHAGRLKVAIVYPNEYKIGMSNLGFHKTLYLFNLRDDVVCERAFLPSREEIEFLRKTGRKIVSMESQTALDKFDLVAFSITFEPDYLNMLSILDLVRIPLRNRGPYAPLLMAGGIAVTMNPEPIAPFFDLFAIGEAEGIIGPLCDSLIEHGKDDLSVFASIPGIYAPSAYEPIFRDDGTIEKVAVAKGYPEKVKRVWDINYGKKPNVSSIMAPDAIFGDMYLVEIGKGCGKHCRFCSAGYVYRPTRQMETPAILDAIDYGINKQGKIGLVGSAVCDHPDVESIFERIVKLGARFSVSSLRLDNLTDSMIDSLKKGGVKTITLAPETGTYRLRRGVNKNITNETILDTAKRVAMKGPFKLKLYFLVGLPGETEEDVRGIADLVKQIKSVMEPEWKKYGRAGGIIVSVDGFVPKAFTPYQWEPFEGIKPVSEKLKQVARGLKTTPNVEVHTGSARGAYVQALLSMGDRSVADILELARRLDGDWSAALRETKIDTARFITRRKKTDEILPWSFIDHGLRPGYLACENALAIKGKVTPECPPADEDCRRCGQFEGVCVTQQTPPSESL